MNLPKLERQTYDISVDSVIIKIKEPTLEQVEKITSLKEIGKRKDIVSLIAEIIASLMDSYDSPIEEKQEFIKKMSYRQIDTLINNLTNTIREKKVGAESEVSSS